MAQPSQCAGAVLPHNCSDAGQHLHVRLSGSVPGSCAATCSIVLHCNTNAQLLRPHVYLLLSPSGQHVCSRVQSLFCKIPSNHSTSATVEHCRPYRHTPMSAYTWFGCYRYTHNAPGPVPPSVTPEIPPQGHAARGVMQMVLLSALWGIATAASW